MVVIRNPSSFFTSTQAPSAYVAAPASPLTSGVPTNPPKSDANIMGPIQAQKDQPKYVEKKMVQVCQMCGRKDHLSFDCYY